MSSAPEDDCEVRDHRGTAASQSTTPIGRTTFDYTVPEIEFAGTKRENILPADEAEGQ
jgi:hypothetical protein